MRVQLSGRLGNQLFELAHAVELSKRFDKKFTLVWDVYSYPSGLSEDLSTLNLDYLERSNSTGLLLKILDKIKKYSPVFEYAICKTNGIYREGHKNNSRMARIVSGHFQDYLLAEQSYREMAELLVRAKIQYQHHVDQLQLPKNYQVIHYRCGDFLSHPGNFGVLSVDYYKMNIDENFPVIVVTDSYHRATQVFKTLGNVKVISPEECNAWAALIVMSEAQLIISSNSTLSWWGAFFVIKKGRRAVIPQPFHANASQNSLFHPGFSVSESIFEEQSE